MKHIILILLFISVTFNISKASGDDSLKVQVPKEDVFKSDEYSVTLIKEALKLFKNDKLKDGLQKFSKGLKMLEDAECISRFQNYHALETTYFIHQLQNNNLAENDRIFLTALMGRVFKTREGNIDFDLKGIAKDNPGSELYLRMLVYYEFLSGKSNKTILADIENVLNVNDTVLSVISLKGLIYFVNENYNAAIESFERCVEIYPEYAYGFYSRAYCYKKSGYLDVRDFEKAAELYPLSEDLWNELGLVYNRLERYPNAIHCFENSLKISPRFSYPYNNIGNCYDNLKMYDSSLVNYTKALEIDPNQFQALANRGNVYFKLKRYEEAIKDYSKCITLYPEKTGIKVFRGNAYLASGKLDSAKMEYKNILKTEFSNFEAIKGLGDCQYKLKKYQKAFNFYKKACVINPAYKEAIFAKANALYAMNEPEKALYNLNCAVDLFPKDPITYLYRSEYYMKMKEYPNAIRDLNKIITLDSLNSNAYFQKGQCYYNLNNFDSCIIYSQIAVGLKEDLDSAKFNIALSALRLGKIAESKQLYFLYYKESKTKNFEKAIADLHNLIYEDIYGVEAKFIIEEILKKK